MLLKRLVLFSLLFFSMKPCSPGPNWTSATIYQEFTRAGAVFCGKVTKRIPQNSPFPHTMIIKKSKFYKGCGKRKNRVKGFLHEATCGDGIPEVGDRICVFVCNDGKHWKLNFYKPHTGMVSGGGANESEIEDLKQSFGYKCPFWRRRKKRYFECDSSPDR